MPFPLLISVLYSVVSCKLENRSTEEKMVVFASVYVVQQNSGLVATTVKLRFYWDQRCS